jgi:hypothetical protein
VVPGEVLNLFGELVRLEVFSHEHYVGYLLSHDILVQNTPQV